jgi:hypothetical protein
MVAVVAADMLVSGAASAVVAAANSKATTVISANKFFPQFYLALQHTFSFCFFRSTK